MNFLPIWSSPKKAKLAAAAPQRENNTQGEREAEPIASCIADLLAKLKALAASGKTQESDALREFAARRHGAALGQMGASMRNVSAGLRSLAGQCAEGAAHLDPNALGRILDRMDSLGDATLRQIEGRIGVTVSRDDRKHLQILRDETRKWLDARDAHLQAAQLAVDDLNARAGMLREQLLARADRLAKASEISAPLAHIPASEALRHASPEAAGFAASLCNLIAAARLTPND